MGPDRDELVVTQHRHVEAFAGIQPPNTADLPERSLPGPRAGRQEREAAVRDQQEEDQRAWEPHLSHQPTDVPYRLIFAPSISRRTAGGLPAVQVSPITVDTASL